jgi:alanine dehydrogenase
MALLLSENDIRQLTTVEALIPVIEEALRHQGEGRADSRPRQRVELEGHRYQTMPASAPGIAGLKTYLTVAGGTQFAVLLFSTESGKLLAMMEGDWLGRLRTGAASGVATRHLARENSTVVGMFGSGDQAATQLVAVCAVRKITLAKVYSRTRSALHDFCQRMAQIVHAEVVPMTHAEAVVEGSDVLITATTASEPLFSGKQLSPGVHINAIGSNRADHRELDTETIRRAELIAVDSVEQARIEAGDLILAAAEGEDPWSKTVELGAILAGRHDARAFREEVTLFKSVGIALEDIAAAAHVYERARAAGVGQEVAFLS